MEINLVAEIGINHNGDIEIAKRLIDCAKNSGFNYVKFQKRTPELCVPECKKFEKKETPWGMMTYFDYKKKIEFNEDEYKIIDDYCKKRNIKWFASVWDLEAAKFLTKFSDLVKIPSAKIVDEELLKFCRINFKKVMVSTGMSTEKQIENAVRCGEPDIILHSNSSYPTSVEELNLLYIKWLRNKWRGREIGYSGHETGINTTIAVVLLVDWIERHITLDKKMWGSDQKASIDFDEMYELVTKVREIEKTKTGYEPRKIYDSELNKLKDLR